MRSTTWQPELETHLAERAMGKGLSGHISCVLSQDSLFANRTTKAYPASHKQPKPEVGT